MRTKKVIKSKIETQIKAGCFQILRSLIDSESCALTTVSSTSSSGSEQGPNSVNDAISSLNSSTCSVNDAISSFNSSTWL